MVSVRNLKGLAMASRHRWPSRWWFWGPVIGANLYLLALYLLPPFPFWGRPSVPLPLFVYRVLIGPVDLFSEFVGRPVMDALGPEVFEDPLTTYAIGMALWELVAVVLGLACYGAVLLVCAIVPDGPDSGGRERSNSWQKSFLC